MRHLLISATLTVCIVGAAQGDEPSSNLNPMSFGADQTIVDIDKVVWGPLELDGLVEGVEIAPLRGDLAKGHAEILLRVPAGYRVPSHTHTSDELYLWLEGAFTLIAHDGTRTDFAGPAYLSFPGNAPPHALECGAEATCLFYLAYSRPFDIMYAPEAANQ